MFFFFLYRSGISIPMIARLFLPLSFTRPFLSAGLRRPVTENVDVMLDSKLKL